MTLVGSSQSTAHQVPSTDVERARKLFEQGRKARATDSDRLAVHAFVEAICLDPSQRQYAKELLAVVSAGRLVGPGALATAWSVFGLRRRLRAAIKEMDWQLALAVGTKLLTLRPKSIPALLGAGQACAAMKHFDSALIYLRYAHKLKPKNVLVNRHCGRVLGKVQQFDEAVGCWRMVLGRVRGDREALEATGRLVTKKMF